jgi:hypothetical protein
LNAIELVDGTAPAEPLAAAVGTEGNENVLRIETFWQKQSDLEQ